MEKRATLTSKGQVTIPADVRKALGIKKGDQVVFEVENLKIGGESRAARMRPAADLIALAGVASPQRGRRDVAGVDARRIAREERALSRDPPIRAPQIGMMDAAKSQLL
ncbi:MAG: AbrB/MazE/SpoVT family DNA-binding domain-containing protein [Candidatus Dormibacteria bacterium]